MKGLIFCHGHRHKAFDLPFAGNWYFADLDPSSDPDFVADYLDPSIADFLGDQWDVVVSGGCPITSSDLDVVAFLETGKKLLKPTGIVLIPGLEKFIDRERRYNQQYPQRSTAMQKEYFQYPTESIILDLASRGGFTSVRSIGKYTYFEQ